MTDLTPEHLTAGSPQSLANIVDCIKQTGGAVEVQGVRIEPLDEGGETATTRNVTGLMESLSQMESKHLRALSLIHHLMRSRRRYQGNAEYWHGYAGNMERNAQANEEAWRIVSGERNEACRWAAWFAAERDESRSHGGAAHGSALALQARVTELKAQVAARDGRIAELEEQCRAAARGVQTSWSLDLWMALGCPVEEFDGYLERNRIAGTWANLLGVVCSIFRPKCGKPTVDGPCVLSEHKTGPCYSRSDVGASEPVPHAEPIANRSEIPNSSPDAYIAVKRYHAVSADGPEWCDDAAVIPAGQTWERGNYQKRGYQLLPIVADGDGTRFAATPPTRCQTTTASPLIDDRRSLWCELPAGHAGMHHAAVPQPGFPATEVDWDDTEEARR